ncbi:hypothetical protein EYF80_030645 [Liparis tanakae]|uniref:Uncharacterized protein n=1 Tax=Liparis tanakae TaxID=230148 RepID=A0A4Z2H0I2_9TELE|nr:hypothetical protein EYF80_030645 [Liparis tanakae]
MASAPPYSYVTSVNAGGLDSHGDENMHSNGQIRRRRPHVIHLFIVSNSLLHKEEEEEEEEEEGEAARCHGAPRAADAGGRNG